jgi:hypothetical protein
MLSSCAEPICENARLLNLAAVLAVAEHPNRDYQRWIHEAFRGYRQQDYEGTADFLMLLFEEFPHSLIAYAAGLSYEQAGMPAEALAHYNLAERTQFYTPLVYYSRGHLYAAQGDTERANRDFSTFSAFQADYPYLAGLSIPEGMESYGLPDSETWTRFPLAEFSHSPGGESAAYIFDEPANTVEIAWLDGGESLAVADLYTPGTKIWGLSLPEVLFFACEDNTCRRALNFHQLCCGLSVDGTYLTITFDDDYTEVMERSIGSESGGVAYAVLLPAPADDPRPTVPCEGSLYPRLQAGLTASAQPHWMPLILYAAPSTDSEVVISGENWERTSFTITGDFVCGEGNNWWPVEMPDGTTGWIQEVGNYGYQITSRDLPQQLTIEELGSVRDCV